MNIYLDFESDIKTLEEELGKLKNPFNDSGEISQVDSEKILKIQEEINFKLKNIYSNLNPWQKTLVARHEERPKSKYFIENLFSDFVNLAGDRKFAEDKSILAGFATFENQSVLVIGQEKGYDLESRISRNFGMVRPEGYRKCTRLMKLADKFNIPVINFIDTPGAYPGIGAEQRGQAEAISESIECCMSLEVPSISIIIGEGGSGGAIALASTNKILMLENAIYSVISPEGCASILWRDPSKSLEAAKAMKLTAKDLLKLSIVDEIIPEPLGGAHRDKDQIIYLIKESIKNNLLELQKLNRNEIYEQRKIKFLKIGKYKSFSSTIHSNIEKLKFSPNFIKQTKNIFINKKNIILSSFLLLGIILLFNVKHFS